MKGDRYHRLEPCNVPLIVASSEVGQRECSICSEMFFGGPLVWSRTEHERICLGRWRHLLGNTRRGVSRMTLTRLNLWSWPEVYVLVRGSCACDSRRGPKLGLQVDGTTVTCTE